MNPGKSNVDSKHSKAVSVHVKLAEFPDYMKDDAVKQSSIAYLDGKKVDEIAKDVKEFFDSKYYPFWQCVVGKKFGNSVTHVSNCFILFALDKLTVVLFKTENGRPWDFDRPVLMNKWRNKCIRFLSKTQHKSSIASEAQSIKEIEGGVGKDPMKVEDTEDVIAEKTSGVETDPTENGESDGETMLI